jgi:UDP-N-acetylmuramyl pentapeptide phosphotransferase/UDP-N-acetylglucosamine-1-phosphate transferase
MKNIGIILIIIGAVMMIFTGFNIVTKKKVVDLGPVEINKDEKTPVRWTPIVGGIILIAGVVVTFTAKKP